MAKKSEGLKIEWLDRRTNKLPFFTLTGTDDLYRQAMKHLEVPYPAAWFSNPDHQGACCHYYTNPKGESVCVVALDILKHIDKDQVTILSMLVHEASHVVEEFFDNIGEKNPASEQRAYALQYVSDELFREYRRQKEALTRRAPDTTHTADDTKPAKRSKTRAR